jgi:hypothetical protein
LVFNGTKESNYDKGRGLAEAESSFFIRYAAIARVVVTLSIADFPSMSSPQINTVHHHFILYKITVFHWRVMTVTVTVQWSGMGSICGPWGWVSAFLYKEGR